MDARNVKDRVWRVLGEAAVITVSILLALGLESWWEDVRDRRAEQRALASLEVEFEETRTELFRARGVHTSRCDATASVRLLLAQDPPGVSPDSLGDLIVGMSRVTTVNAPVGVLNGLITSGELALIRDAELKALLAGWPERLADHRESEDFTFIVIRDQWRPWLFENAVLSSHWARTAAPADSAVDLSSLPALLSNQTFANFVTANDSDCAFVLSDSEALEQDIDAAIEQIRRNRS